MDEKTARSAMHKLSIRFLEEIKVKGKAIPVNIYEAIDTNQITAKLIQQK